MPHELLPMFPPIVQRECDDGSGPNTRFCSPVCSLSCSLMTPVWQVTRRPATSTSPMPVRYLEKSMITALLTVSPDRLVPPPRQVTGARYAEQAFIVCTTSSSVFGTTTPIGTCR